MRMSWVSGGKREREREERGRMEDEATSRKEGMIVINTRNEKIDYLLILTASPSFPLSSTSYFVSFLFSSLIILPLDSRLILKLSLLKSFILKEMERKGTKWEWKWKNNEKKREWNKCCCIHLSLLSLSCGTCNQSLFLQEYNFQSNRNEGERQKREWK